MRLRLIGDPHITRKFVQNVPLSRRGEREEMLFTQFERELNEGTERMVVMVGDLFEKPICSLNDLYRIIRMILLAADTHPSRQYVMMAGNHDRSAQQDDWGAFDILQLLRGQRSNLQIFTKPETYLGVAFFPWEWERSALEQLEDLRGKPFDVAVGHWDLVAYDEMHLDHFCPAQELVAMGATTIYSGHWHVAGDYIIDGVTVHCTGSMQPMTHAEDPDGNLYVTLTLEEYNEIEDLSTLRGKYVRVIAPKGEDPESLGDCLGFKVVRDSTGFEDTPVAVEEFKTSEVVERVMTKHDVPNEVRTFIKERIDADD